LKYQNVNRLGTKQSNAETNFPPARHPFIAPSQPGEEKNDRGVLPAKRKKPVGGPADREMSVMSNSVKTRFAGLLRGLLRRLDDDDEAPAYENPRSLTVTAPPVPATPVAHTPPPAPVPEPSAAAMFPVPATNPDELQLPLQPILAGLPMDLRAKVMQTPPEGLIISIPLEKILTQLAFGSVKIPFGDLRQSAPGVFVNSGGEHDHKSVTLPLNEILTRLNPALLSRRSTQKHVEVAEEITGPFDGRGQGISISKTPLKPVPSPTPVIPTPAAKPMRLVTPVAPTPIRTTPVALPPTTFTRRAMTPAANNNPTTPENPASVPPTAPLANGFVMPRINGTSKSATPQIAAQVAAPRVAAPPVAPPTPQIPVEPAIAVPLAALLDNWPEGLRLEIRQSNLANAQVLLPVTLIEPALKRGRVTSTWRKLRTFIMPTPPTSIHDGIELELPLNVIAPLFFTRQKTSPRPQPVQQPPAEIPNLFFGFPQPEAPQPEPVAKMPAPPTKMLEPQTPAPEPQVIHPAVKPVDAKLADTNYYIWSDSNEAPKVDETEYRRPLRPATDFTSRYATPAEIITRAMALPGVVGALVALPDGLKVASQTPSDLNADTLAAFLPQIFDRVSQCTKELRMGALNNINFTVGNVPWKIFRVNAVYFAAFGRAGEALPTVQLAALAAELDRKKQ